MKYINSTLLKKSFCFLILSYLIISCSTNKSEEQELPDPLEAGWKGKKVCEVLKETDKIRILKCTFAPKVGHELHYHNPHYGYTLKGSKFRITDTTGTREIQVPSGSDFSNDKITHHQVMNIGDSTAVFLIIEPK